MSRVRICGGEWRSRLLPIAKVSGLRPTPDRVRETLFNWLGQDLEGLDCLDLFAGTGVLGFEAASRRANSVILVERNPLAFEALRDAKKTLQASHVEIVRDDAVEFARRCSRRFDLLFLDPPYRQGWLDQLQPLLGKLVKPDGWLYVEAETPLDKLGQWQTVRSGRAGQVCFHLMKGPDE